MTHVPKGQNYFADLRDASGERRGRSLNSKRAALTSMR